MNGPGGARVPEGAAQIECRDSCGEGGVVWEDRRAREPLHGVRIERKRRPGVVRGSRQLWKRLQQVLFVVCRYWRVPCALCACTVYRSVVMNHGY